MVSRSTTASPAARPSVMDPAAPGGSAFVSGQRHRVQVVRKRWTPFIAFMEGHNLTNAYNLALLANLAYQGDKTAEGPEAVRDAFRSLWSRERDDARSSLFFDDLVLHQVDEPDALDPETYTFLESAATETQAYGIAGNGYTLLGFRGTEVGADWLRDANFQGMDYGWGPGQLHRGFGEGFESIREAMDDFLDVNWTPGSPIVLCGHSLGGALSSIAATYLRVRRTEDVVLYTYASPRAGSRQFARYFTDERPFVAHRHVLHADMVPRLPVPGLELDLGPGALITPFVDVDLDPWDHVGQLWYYEHFDSGEVRSTPLSRATGPIGWEMTGWNPLATYAEVMESMLDEAERRVRDSVDEFVRDVSHPVADHFMEVSYIPVVRHEFRAGARAWLDLRAPSRGAEIAHGLARAEQAEREATIAYLRRRIDACRLELTEILVARETRQRGIAVQDNLVRPPVWLPDGRRLLDGPSEAERAEAAREAALRHEIQQWQRAVAFHEVQYRFAKSSAEAVYQAHSSVSGFDPVEGLSEEFERHVGP